MDYKAKYLKYKNKYLSLQRDIEGGGANEKKKNENQTNNTINDAINQLEWLINNDSNLHTDKFISSEINTDFIILKEDNIKNSSINDICNKYIELDKYKYNQLNDKNVHNAIIKLCHVKLNQTQPKHNTNPKPNLKQTLNTT
jgi:hypothetical protein